MSAIGVFDNAVIRVTDSRGNTFDLAPFTIVVAPPLATLTFTSPTADNTPMVSGTAVSNATVEVDYGGEVPAVTVAANGAWSLVLPTQADGTHDLKVRQTFNGVTSAWSAVQRIVVDTTPPTFPTITTSSPQRVTVGGTPTIEGTVSEDAVSVAVYLDGAKIGDADLSDLAWSYTLDPLAIGDYEVTATATDALGNESSRSAPLAVSVRSALAVDATPPVEVLVVGTPYEFMLTASGGFPPYAFSVQSGTLPTGLSLDPSGVISGTPTEGGVFEDIVFEVEDIQ